MTKIDSFSGEHEFLSNFSSHPVQAGTIIFPTVEHAFQAAKTMDESERQNIALAITPVRAKRMGRTVTLRPDWEQVKLEVMTDLLITKFATHSDIAEKLIATGDAELIDENHEGDQFWGVCDGEGQNHLGKLLMEVRTILQRRAYIQGKI